MIQDFILPVKIMFSCRFTSRGNRGIYSSHPRYHCGWNSKC